MEAGDGDEVGAAGEEVLMGRYLALVPMALALAACGGGGGGGLSLDPVARAAARTSDAGSVRFTMHIEGGVPTGQYISVTARGFLNNADASGRASYVFVEAGKPKFHMTGVFDGSALYMKSKAFASKLPDGKTWIKIDEKDLKKAGLGSLSDAQQGTPTQSLKALRASGHTVKIGPATVGGVPTTKYHTTVDLEKEKLADEMGAKRLPVDAWIDRKGRLRKVTFALSPPDPTKAGKFSLLLGGFGPAITVEPPPSDQTVDINDALG
jgi:hypothetical protein